MPEGFSISTADSSIALEGKPRSGVVKYTVSHTLARTVSARADLVPEGETRATWLTVQPDRQPIPAGGHPSFVVEIRPQDAKPGTYTFHLRIVDDDHPDDLSTDGPTASFVVRDDGSPPRPPRWLWILVAVLGLAIVATGGWLVWCKALGRCAPTLPIFAACTESPPCAEGLTCAPLPSGDERQCRRAPGEPCASAGECSSWWCSEQRCTRDDGRCANPAECRLPFVCESGMCLKRVGTACTRDAECAAPGRCAGGLCSATNPKPCTLRCPVFTRCEWFEDKPRCVRRRDLVFDPTFESKFEVTAPIPLPRRPTP